MTRKHFQAIADALRESGAPFHVVKEVADALACFNRNFDRQRFYRAAGVES